MMVVVLKPFKSNGEDFVRDQLADGGEFRNVDVLLSQRYLRHATSDEISSARFEGDDEEPDADTESEEEEQDETERTAASEDSDEEEEKAPPRRPKKKLKAVAKKKAVVRKKTRGLKAKAKSRRR